LLRNTYRRWTTCCSSFVPRAKSVVMSILPRWSACK